MLDLSSYVSIFMNVKSEELACRLTFREQSQRIRSFLGLPRHPS
jgi:hypothetical protein